MVYRYYLHLDRSRIRLSFKYNGFVFEKNNCLEIIEHNGGKVCNWNYRTCKKTKKNNTAADNSFWQRKSLHCRRYIESFYNLRRNHSHCGYISPIEFENIYWAKQRKKIAVLVVFFIDIRPPRSFATSIPPSLVSTQRILPFAVSMRIPWFFPESMNSILWFLVCQRWQSASSEGFGGLWFRFAIAFFNEEQSCLKILSQQYRAQKRYICSFGSNLVMSSLFCILLRSAPT